GAIFEHDAAHAAGGGQIPRHAGETGSIELSSVQAHRVTTVARRQITVNGTLGPDVGRSAHDFRWWVGARWAAHSPEEKSQCTCSKVRRRPRRGPLATDDVCGWVWCWPRLWAVSGWLRRRRWPNRLSAHPSRSSIRTLRLTCAQTAAHTCVAGAPSPG